MYPSPSFEASQYTVYLCPLFGTIRIGAVVSPLFNSWNAFSHRSSHLNLTPFRARTKKSLFSIDFSAKNWFPVVLEKIFGWKNRLQKNRGKIRKNRRFFADFSEMADFSAFELHAPGRRVRAASFVYLSAIKSKYRRFFNDFSAFFRNFLLNYSGH